MHYFIYEYFQLGQFLIAHAHIRAFDLQKFSSNVEHHLKD